MHTLQGTASKCRIDAVGWAAAGCLCNAPALPLSHLLARSQPSYRLGPHHRPLMLHLLLVDARPLLQPQAYISMPPLMEMHWPVM